ncbi:MAG: hypothetical protein KatS3mg060_2070 [Dehalococcoidia bacterium]|nr:MAG: hypothetical protein KatS3mg060_2070 [Dehalococcoidia bacterium]
MSSVRLLAGLLAFGERDLRAATDALPMETVHWAPPGTANPIGATWLHVLAVQDWGIHLMQQRPSIWDREGWSERLGTGAPLRQDAARARALRVDPAAVRAYADSVFAATRAFLAGLTDEDLNRIVASPERQMSIGEGLQLLAYHLAQHVGELLALRGILATERR